MFANPVRPIALLVHLEVTRMPVWLVIQIIICILKINPVINCALLDFMEMMLFACPAVKIALLVMLILCTVHLVIKEIT